MTNAKQLVVKLGTEVLLGKRWIDNKHLDQRIFNKIAGQVIEVQNLGVAVTIVSSGAIQAGREKIEKLERNIIRLESIRLERKELAGIGARHLLNMWGKGFGRHSREIAEMWVTYGNWNNEGERQSMRSSILNYHKQRVIPIVNENDVISDKEIRLMDKGLGENDRLARMVAELLNADAILFLTNGGGIYEEDPTLNPGARLYAEIDIETAMRLAAAPGATSPIGAGGIGAKLREASICAKREMRVAIAGMGRDTIYKFAIGKPVGTIMGDRIRFRR